MALSVYAGNATVAARVARAREYQRRQARLAQLMSAQLLALWDMWGPAAVAAPSPGGGASVLAGGQFSAAAMAGEWIAGEAKDQLLDLPENLLRAEGFAGRAASGVPLPQVLGSVAPLRDAEIAAGRDPVEAALAARGRLARIAENETRQAAVNAEGVGLYAASEKLGYVRILTPPSCYRCVILAGRRYRAREPFNRHPGCDCQHLPVNMMEWVPEDDPTVDPYSYFRSLTAGEQDRWLGKGNAQAVRDGADLYRVANVKQRGGGLIKWQVGGTPKHVRMTPAEIYARTKNREDAVALLRANGYIRGVPAGATDDLIAAGLIDAGTLRPLASVVDVADDVADVVPDLPPPGVVVTSLTRGAYERGLDPELEELRQRIEGWYARHVTAKPGDHDANWRAAVRGAFSRDQINGTKAAIPGADGRAALREMLEIGGDADNWLARRIGQLMAEQGEYANPSNPKVKLAMELHEAAEKARDGWRAVTNDAMDLQVALLRKHGYDLPPGGGGFQVWASLHHEDLPDELWAEFNETWRRDVLPQALQRYADVLPPDLTPQRYGDLVHHLKQSSSSYDVRSAVLLEGGGAGGVGFGVPGSSAAERAVSRYSSRYALAQREAALELTAALGDGGTVSKATKFVYKAAGGDAGKATKAARAQAVDVLTDVATEYPVSWQRHMGQLRPQTWVDIGSRGWNQGQGWKIRLSGGLAGVGIPGSPSAKVAALRQTAVHEIGHTMERAVPGLQDAEWVFLAERIGIDPKTSKEAIEKGTSTGLLAEPRKMYGYQECSFFDDFGEAYTAKTYGRWGNLNYPAQSSNWGLEPSSDYEVFTTGIESLLHGSDYFWLDDTLDAEFRSFILGSLIVLGR